MFLLCTYLHRYTKIEPKKCIQKNVPFRISDILIIFICIAFPFFNLFINLFSENVSIAFYFYLHNKYMVQLSHFPVFTSAVDFSKYLVIALLDIFTKQKRQFDWNMTDSATILIRASSMVFKQFLPTLVCHDCTLVLLLYKVPRLFIYVMVSYQTLY